MDRLITEDKVEYSISKALEHYNQAKPQGSVNLFLFLLAQRHLEEPPPLFFVFHSRFHLELEAAARNSPEVLEVAMRNVGHALMGQSLAPVN